LKIPLLLQLSSKIPTPGHAPAKIVDSCQSSLRTRDHLWSAPALDYFLGNWRSLLILSESGASVYPAILRLASLNFWLFRTRSFGTKVANTIFKLETQANGACVIKLYF